VHKVLDTQNLSSDEIKLYIFHQANQRMLEAIGSRLGAGRERVFSNVAHYGNTAVASIPIAYNEAVRSGKIHENDSFVMCGFGVGMQAAALLFRK